MTKAGGWFETHVPDAGPGTRYRFRIDDELDIPDPISHFQPDDITGPSEVIDHSLYRWQCADWKGLPWERAVFLETHVGTFTPEGTYRAMMAKLDHLADTGITALELMPLADFPGRWNWGYDGVLPFAPDSAYGTPEDLKALIDAAHARGIMVFLDVVYNHFGPEGNYLGRHSPPFFAEAHTPWGVAIDYRVPEVRAYVIENALHWLRDYRFDGLRLDAVHAIVDPGAPHILIDLARAVNAFAAESGRHIHLVLENDDNAARFLAPASEGIRRLLPRAMERRLPSRLARAVDAAKAAATTATIRTSPPRSRARWRKGSPIRAKRPPTAAARRAAKRAGICRAPISSTSSRTTTRSATGRSASGCRCWSKPEAAGSRARRAAAAAVAAADVHGRRMGRDRTVPVLLRLQGRARRSRAQGPQGRVRRMACAGRRRHSRSAGAGDQGCRRARLERADEAAACGAAGVHACACCKARREHIAPLLPAMIGAGEASLENGVLRAQWRAGGKTLMLLANSPSAAWLAEAAPARPPGD